MRSVVPARGRSKPPVYVPEARLRTDITMKVAENVGGDLRKVRLSFGLTLHDVATSTGYALPLLGRLEGTTTAPSENVTARILRALLTAP